MIGYILGKICTGVYRDNGKENGSYSKEPLGAKSPATSEVLCWV